MFKWQKEHQGELLWCLFPCPFCGGTPIEERKEKYGKELAYIECTSCGAKTKMKQMYVPKDDTDEEIEKENTKFNDLLELWNRRVDSKWNDGLSN